MTLSKFKTNRAFTLLLVYFILNPSLALCLPSSDPSPSDSPTDGPQSRQSQQSDIAERMAEETGGGPQSRRPKGGGEGRGMGGRMQFGNPGQDNITNAVKTVSLMWRMMLANPYRNPHGGDPKGPAESIQQCWKQTQQVLNAPQAEEVLGKEFFAAFMQYYKNAIDGTMQYLAGDFAKAAELLRQAKAAALQLKQMKKNAITETLTSMVDKMLVEISIYLGVVEVVGGNTAAGLACMRSGYDDAAKAKWPWGKAQVALFMALTADQVNDPSAKELYKQALRVAKKTKTPFFIWQCYFGLGMLAMKKGDADETIKNLQQSLNTIESMRTKIDEDMQKTDFMGDKFQVYQLMMLALLNKRNIQGAFELSENAKSRALLDLLSSKQKEVQHAGNVDPALLQRERELTEQIDAADAQEGKEADAQSIALRQEYKKVLEQIKQANPELGSLISGEFAGLAQVQALLDDRTVLLEYHLIPEKLIVWLVTKNSIRVKLVSLDRQKLAQKVQAIRMMICKPKMPAVYKLLGQLHQSIVEPFSAEIEGKNLILAPDASLYYLPFAALMDKEGKFLIEKHAISYVPSFNVLKYCAAKRKDGVKTILAFGNPDLGDPKLDLPNAQLEAQTIAKEFPQTKLVLRKEASETTAKKIMGNFDIVHFACHGEMDPEQPLRSCLRLVPDDANDGRLEAGEVFDLALNSQLVVLSGCETGQGKFREGDEILGLTRCFLYAGTPSVIVSFWKVDDNATSLLMSSFYKNLTGNGKAEALQKAQIETMKTKKHPFYWASFYLVGDGK